MERLQRFDLESYKEPKKVLIDAISEEGLEGFDKLTPQGAVYETLLYDIAHIDEILGLLRYIFQLGEQNLNEYQVATHSKVM